MTLLAPFALAGLALLPVLWWLHRRAQRPPLVEVPSLLFLEPEARPATARVARRLDAELAITLAAALCLVLAAAGPLVRLGAPGRTVRVAALPPGWAGTEAYRRGLDATLAQIGERLTASDRLEVTPLSEGARPSDASLLAAVRAGAASLRVVVSDRLPAEVPSDVRWVAHGLPDAENLGIVAASLSPQGPGIRVFVNVANDGTQPEAATLRVTGGSFHAPAGEERALLVPAGGYATASFDLREAPETVHVVLEAPADAVPGDGYVYFRRTPLRVRFEAGLPPTTREAVEQGLRAVLGAGGFEVVTQGADFGVGTLDTPASPVSSLLRIGAAPGGAPGARAPEGVDVGSEDPLAADLSTSGVDLVYAPGTDRIPEGAEVLFARRAGASLLPVLLRRGGVVDLVPDPLQGGAPLVRSAFWPLLLDNLIREKVGAPTEGGYRLALPPSPDRVRVGRDVRAFDPRWLEDARPDRPAPERPLAPWLAAAAGIGLLALWSLPWGANRRARLGRAPAGS